MTRHLTSGELIAALDSSVDPARTAHLEACEACRVALADLRAVLADVHSANDIPEPSPLFWEHLSRRVRIATSEVPAGRQTSWWRREWRPLLGVGVGTAVAVLALALYETPVVPVASDVAGVRIEAGRSAAVSPVQPDLENQETSWNNAVQMASTLSPDDVFGVVASRLDTPIAVYELTREEREAFVKLLDAEVGDIQ